MTLTGEWSRRLLFLVLLGLAGCGTAVSFVQEGEGKGVMLYLYRAHQSPFQSPNRKKAYQRIQRYCMGAYDIVQEGPTKGKQHVVDGIAGQEIVGESWWGIRFRCQKQKQNQKS